MNPSVTITLETFFRERQAHSGHLSDPDDRYIREEFRKQGMLKIQALYRAWRRQGDGVLWQAHSTTLRDDHSHGCSAIEVELLNRQYLRRPALDQLVLDARRRRFDVVVCWSLDRMGRSLKHLVILLDDLQALGVGFISVREGLDWTTPSGRLQAQGRKLGRPESEIPVEHLASVMGLPVREAARRLAFPAPPSNGRWCEYRHNRPCNFLGTRVTLRTSGVARLLFRPIDLTRMSPYIAHAERVCACSVRTSGWSEEVYHAETNCSRPGGIGGGFGR